MASIRVFTYARMAAIEAATIISGTISGNNLILSKKDGGTVDAGNVRGPQGIQGATGAQGPIGNTGAQGPQGVKGDTGATGPAGGTTAVKDNIAAGLSSYLGNISGAVNLGTIASNGLTPDGAVNALLSATLTGNVTLDKSQFQSGMRAGTQFSMVLIQDATGGRTLTLTGFKKPGGALALSTAANAVDILIFFYDGTSWYVTAAGKAFA